MENLESRAIMIYVGRNLYPSEEWFEHPKGSHPLNWLGIEVKPMPAGMDNSCDNAVGKKSELMFLPPGQKPYV